MIYLKKIIWKYGRNSFFAVYQSILGQPPRSTRQQKLENRLTMDWTVYILECADGSLYTGITKDLTRRITEHETGKGARYTAGRGPFRLVHQEFHENRSEATKREAAIKTMNRAEKLELIPQKPLL